ncbi:MAG TPA: hypothetical protein VM536_13720 [Chloroflexia bacterium]|nr:hypothetical protein [Chloroflexia bacterium]
MPEMMPTSTSGTGGQTGGQTGGTPGLPRSGAADEMPWVLALSLLALALVGAGWRFARRAA